ncbi:uncharacterized protein B0H64DRAFT_168910 [Chaetomium fimeti]|uniref:Uncharacterized protein n=1 Tax=Chaetomium fimeti TaxID=1854472 RepID=A0AAE0HH43_9PEZI|nr:hypothetical protein B0H64DRAFT_168910 [Chaetomium fimeti]
MAAPPRHDAASDAAFLVSGMDRDCGYLQQVDVDEIDLLLPQAAGVEETQDQDSWRDGAYTSMLLMELDFISPPKTDTGQDNSSDDIDKRSVEVSFDEEDLARGGVELRAQHGSG